MRQGHHIRADPGDRGTNRKWKLWSGGLTEVTVGIEAPTRLPGPERLIRSAPLRRVTDRLTLPRPWCTHLLAGSSGIRLAERRILMQPKLLPTPRSSSLSVVARLASALVALSLLATACGSDDAVPATTTVAQAATTAAPAATRIWNSNISICSASRLERKGSKAGLTMNGSPSLRRQRQTFRLGQVFQK